MFLTSPLPAAKMVVSRGRKRLARFHHDKFLVLLQVSRPALHANRATANATTQSANEL